LQKLAFPFEDFRGGQRDLARRVYQAIRDRRNLFAEAPTGLGKTIATLFPAAKALPLLEEGKVFFLTAKTPGRIAAAEAIEHLRRSGARLRSLILTAKNKICFNETPNGCDLRTCPYAIGYHERIRPALRELLDQEQTDRPTVESIAQKHRVCPHELSLDASSWSDMVIGDFDHAFDPSARLQRHFAEGGRRQHIARGRSPQSGRPQQGNALRFAIGSGPADTARSRAGQGLPQGPEGARAGESTSERGG
jgi:DNA excision repair protein ERCC-2